MRPSGARRRPAGAGVRALVAALALAAAAGQGGYDIVVVAGQSNSMGRLGEYAPAERVPLVTREGRPLLSAQPPLLCAVAASTCGMPATEYRAAVAAGISYAPLSPPYFTFLGEQSAPWAGDDAFNNGVGPAHEFVTRYVNGSLGRGRSVLLVPASIGGTPISLWAPGAQLFERMMAAVEDGMRRVGEGGGASATGDATATSSAAPAYGPNRVVALLVHHGEADAARRGYFTAVAAMVAAFRARVGNVSGAPVPVVLGQTELSYATAGYSAWGAAAGMLRAWLPGLAPASVGAAEVTAALPRAALVTAAGLRGGESRSAAPGGDAYHFDAPSARELGRRYYSAWACLTAAGGRGASAPCGMSQIPTPLPRYRWACAEGKPTLVLPSVPSGAWWGPEHGTVWSVQAVRVLASPSPSPSAGAPPSAAPLPDASGASWLTPGRREGVAWHWPAGDSSYASPVFTFTPGSLGGAVVLAGLFAAGGVLRNATDVGGFFTAPFAAQTGTAALYARLPAAVGGAVIRADLSDDLRSVALPVWVLCAARPELAATLCAGNATWQLYVAAGAFLPAASGGDAPAQALVRSALRVVPLPAPLPAAARNGCAGGWAVPALPLPDGAVSRSASATPSASPVSRSGTPTGSAPSPTTTRTRSPKPKRW